MTGITWREPLRRVFQPFSSPAEINPNQFLTLLGQNQVNVHQSIADRFNELKDDEKKDVINFLWDLARLDDLPHEERLKLLARVADRYERVFESEEEESPGWFLPS